MAFTSDTLLSTIDGDSIQSIAPGSTGMVATQQAAGAPTMSYPMALTTGVLTGGEVTVNGGDNTLVDIAAGTGVIEDWTTPTAPVMTRVTWNAFTAEAMPNLATGVFTSLAITATNTLEKTSGVSSTPQEQRAKIYLQTAVHVGGTQVESISGSSMQAYQVINALFDYVSALGPVNTGNAIGANGANLTIDKASGTTTLPFINRVNDPQSPSELVNAAASPVASFNRHYQDGVGGFTITTGHTAVDPDFYDDGTGTLNSVTNNRFTIKRCYYFAQTDALTLTYGQAEYTSIDNALDAIFTEDPVISPLFAGGKFVTAIIVQEGATDLSDVAQAKFVFEG